MQRRKTKGQKLEIILHKKHLQLIKNGCRFTPETMRETPPGLRSHWPHIFAERLRALLAFYEVAILTPAPYKMY